MPRGVAIDGARQRLFAAAEAVVLRSGVDGLSGRAVTAQAGVATGLLHAHFGDFDGFLAAYAVDRSFLLAADAAEAGGDGPALADVLCARLDALTQPAATAFARLLAARPALRDRAAEVLGDGSAGFDGVTAAVAATLESAADDGRLSPAVDPTALAYAIVGAALRAWCAGDPDARWHAAVRASVTAIVRAD